MTFQLFKNNISPNDLRAFFFDEEADVWVSLDPPTILDETDEAFILEVELLHFSIFGLAVPEGGGGLGGGNSWRWRWSCICNYGYKIS